MVVKKYKCIQGYPDCRKGTIVRYHPGTYSEYWDENTGKRYQQMIIEHYPEFWEEVKEKEYEILEVFVPKNKQILSWEKDACIDSYWKDKEHWLKYHLNEEPKSKIYSIKRLSDGEVFTLGDKMYGYDLGRAVNLSVIKIEDGRCLIGHRDLGFIELKNARKAKLPLFTTEDGIDIYEGDKFSYVNYLLSGFYNVTAFKTSTIKEGMKAFSTKEAAEKWIDENKPKYSKKDIINLIEKVAIESKHSLCCYLGREVDYESYSLIELANKIRCDETI